MRKLSWIAISLAVAATAACTAPTGASDDEELVATDEAEATAAIAPGTHTYFVIRRDMRRCMSPMCGGYFVKRVNATRTRCVDGSWQESCYVAAIDTARAGLAETTLSDQDMTRVVVRGAIVRDASIGAQVGGVWGRFDVTEAWAGSPAGASHDAIWSGRTSANGFFHRFQPNSIRCFRAPCPSIDALRLNSSAKRAITGFGGSLAGKALSSLAEGPLLGSAWTRSGRDGSVVASLTQLYTRVADPVDPLACDADADCTRSTYGSLVESAADCFCPMCPSFVMNVTAAQANAEAFAQHCSASSRTCPQPRCMRPPEVACVNHQCQARPLEPALCRVPTVAPTHARYGRFEAPSRKNDCMQDSECMVGGCSGEVCAAESVPSTCEALADKPKGSCGCLDGKCQWNDTAACAP